MVENELLERDYLTLLSSEDGLTAKAFSSPGIACILVSILKPENSTDSASGIARDSDTS